MCSSIFVNDFIFKVEYVGSGNYLEKEISCFLEEKGIKNFARFSKIDIENLGNKIVEYSKDISFAECKKCGNILQVNLVSKNTYKEIEKVVSVLKADCDGVIESAKIYSGTFKFNVGDSVKCGDILVDGYMQIKDIIVKTDVVASVFLLCKSEFLYTSNNNCEEEIAKILAVENLGQKTFIVSNDVIIEQLKDKYIYKVYTTYRHKIFV